MKYIKKFIDWLYDLLFEKSKPQRNLKQTTLSYSKKNFLTDAEKIFHKKLKNIEMYGYIVIPQVNLASIITKKSDCRYNTELFRNIDFGIFDKDYNLLLLVELNDRTHKDASRHKRDLKVKEICENAQIKLIFFYSSYPNEKDYIINRILKELESI